jgi:hypothetical protein
MDRHGFLQTTRESPHVIILAGSPYEKTTEFQGAARQRKKPRIIAMREMNWFTFHPRNLGRPRQNQPSPMQISFVLAGLRLRAARNRESLHLPPWWAAPYPKSPEVPSFRG